jgi:hypothetical protein
MNRILASTALAIGVATLGLAAQQPTFRATEESVRVFVTVTDRDGRLVTTLAQTDFEIRDEGKPQPITTFDNTPQPIRLVVMLDVSGSMTGNLPLLRAGAEQLYTGSRSARHFPGIPTLSAASFPTPLRPMRPRRSGVRWTRRWTPSAIRPAKRAGSSWC